MSEPLISVLLPVFNAGNQLRPAVLSIINQTYSNWELLIVDDGSTDGALNLIKDISDSRIIVMKKESNRGVTVRLNEAVSLAKGEYIARMDQDDISYPRRLELQLDFLMNNPRVDLLATKCIAIDKNNQIVGLMRSKLNHCEISSKPWSGFLMPHPTWMAKTEWFKRFMYADPGPYFCDDQELLLRAHKVTRFACLGEVLFAYRVRDRINFKKNLKTRLTLLRLQIMTFSKPRDWLAISLSVLSAVAKIGFDGLRLLANKGPVNTKAQVDNKTRADWADVLKEIMETDGKSA